MVKRCLNPDCPNEFRHLNSGDLYALDCGTEDTKFLWLCGDCATTVAIAVDEAGTISVQKRSLKAVSRIVPASHTVRLRLIAGHAPLDPWRRANIRARSDALPEDSGPRMTPQAA